jgi:hypothetical protein
MEALLCQPAEDEPVYRFDGEMNHRCFTNTKGYFFAAAVALDYSK